MHAFIQAVQCLLHLFSSKVIFLTFQMFVSGQTRKKIYLPLRCACVCVCSIAKSCPTLCDPVDSSPPNFSVHEILQARILQGVVISSSRRSSQSRDWTRISCIAGRFFPAEPPGKPFLRCMLDYVLVEEEVSDD